MVATTDRALAIQREKQADAFRKLIIQSFLASVVDLLSPTPSILRESPNTICELIKANIHDAKIENHEVLDVEARSNQFLPGTDFDVYISKQVSIRQKMVNVNYPNIAHERTTVRYMLQRLSNYPEFRIIAIFLAGKPPTTVRQLTTLSDKRS